MSKKIDDGLTKDQRWRLKKLQDDPDYFARRQRLRRESRVELERERTRAMYAKHAEKRRAYAKDAFQLLKDGGYTDAYRKRDSMKKAARRAAMMGAEGSLTRREWEQILEAFGRSCKYCGASDAPLEMDHVVPLPSNGSPESQRQRGRPAPSGAGHAGPGESHGMGSRTVTRNSRRTLRH